MVQTYPQVIHRVIEYLTPQEVPLRCDSASSAAKQRRATWRLSGGPRKKMQSEPTTIRFRSTTVPRSGQLMQLPRSGRSSRHSTRSDASRGSGASPWTSRLAFGQHSHAMSCASVIRGSRCSIQGAAQNVRYRASMTGSAWTLPVVGAICAATLGSSTTLLAGLFFVLHNIQYSALIRGLLVGCEVPCRG